MFYLLSRLVSYVLLPVHLLKGKRVGSSNSRALGTAERRQAPSTQLTLPTKPSNRMIYRSSKFGSCIGSSWALSCAQNRPSSGCSLGELSKLRRPKQGADERCGAIHRFPFYYECKTIVILWLTLPQIQVSFGLPHRERRGKRTLRAYTTDLTRFCTDNRARPTSTSPMYILSLARMRRRLTLRSPMPRFARSRLGSNG